MRVGTQELVKYNFDTNAVQFYSFKRLIIE